MKLKLLFIHSTNRLPIRTTLLLPTLSLLLALPLAAQPDARVAGTGSGVTPEEDAGKQWPQFRGPGALPVADQPGLPTSWSQQDNVEWVAEVPGVGWSSPIVWGKRVFVTSATSDQSMKQPSLGTDFSNNYIFEMRDQGLPAAEINRRLYARDRELPHELQIRLMVFCLDLETGELLWERQVYAGNPLGGRHRKNSFASETPVTDGKLVYAYFTQLGLFAFDFEGKPSWSTTLPAHPSVRDYGTGASPVIHGNQLIILNDNEESSFLAAFDKRDGRLLWRTNRSFDAGRKTGWSTPLVWENSGRTEIVTMGPGQVISYDLGGQPLWSMGRMAGSPIQSPFAWNGLLFVTSGTPGARLKPLAAIRPGAVGDITPGEEATSNEYVAWYDRVAGGTYMPTPLIYGDALYVLTSNGIISRLDPLTGEREFRARVAEGADAFTASPWAYNGHIFALGEDGSTFVIEASKDYQLVRVNSLNDWTLASPAIVGERLLIRTQGKLYSLRGTP